MVCDRLLRQFFRGQRPFPDLLTDFAHGAPYLIPPSVIDGDLEMQPVIVFGRFLKFCYSFADVRIQSGLIAQNPDAHPVLLRRLQTGLHIIAQKLHQGIHFFLRSAPVLR